MAILPKAIYKFNTNPSKFQHNSSQTSKKKNGTQLHLDIWKSKKPRIVKTILCNQRTSGGITTPKPYYRATVMNWKQSDTGIKTGRRTNGTKSKTRILIHTPLNTWFLTKKQKKPISNGKKKAYLTNGAGITGYQYADEWKYIHIYHHAQNSGPNGSMTSS